MADTQSVSMTAPPQVYRARRAKLASTLTRPLVLFAGHAPARNYPTNPHEFRAGSSYLYFGGPPLENATLLVEPGSDGEAGCTLLRPPVGPDDVLWTGPVPSDAELTAAVGLRATSVADPDQLEHFGVRDAHHLDDGAVNPLDVSYDPVFCCHSLLSSANKTS